ncbi:MAG: peptidoglycan-binding protein [Candidatus Taylorbacteria bacterium]|nr:peptidoglycan-binding protein [Candidatus Taylorbacteria bacterium]
MFSLLKKLIFRKPKIFIAIFLFFFTFQFIDTSADAPTVVSFVSTESIESAQVANLTWSINGGGHTLMVPCIQGVKLFYDSNKTVFPCGTRVSVSKQASDGISLVIVNVSGSMRIITARIIPKDAYAKDYDLGARETSVTVYPVNQPITGFFSNATTTKSGTATIFYWTSKHLDGVNIKISCNESVTATLPTLGGKFVPCDKMIFPTDLPGTGLTSIMFANPSSIDQPVDITLFPAMAAGFYDGLHPNTINLSIASDAQKPVSILFYPNKSKISSGELIYLNWSITNAVGANIKFTCSTNIKLQSFTATAITDILCGEYAWVNPLSASSTIAINVSGQNQESEIVSVTIFPYLKDKTYDARQSRSFNLQVDPAKTLILQTEIPIVPTLSTSTTVVLPPVTINAKKDVFARWLGPGSKGEDVKLLQIFLAKDKKIYPEGYKTGYYGKTTKSAVGRYQLKYKIILTAKDSIYGTLDPITRYLLNSQQ